MRCRPKLTNEQLTTALARKNAESDDERPAMVESESFNRVLVSLLQKTVLEQVLDIVCTEAQGLIGAAAGLAPRPTRPGWRSSTAWESR